MREALTVLLRCVRGPLAGIAEVKALSVGGAWAYFSTDLVDQSVRASLLFASAGCFERVVRTSGSDITNLLVRRDCLLSLQAAHHPLLCSYRQIAV